MAGSLQDSLRFRGYDGGMEVTTMGIWRNRVALGYVALGVGLTLGAAGTMEWASAQNTKKPGASQSEPFAGEFGQPPQGGGFPGGGQGFPGGGPGQGFPGGGPGQGFRGMGPMMGGGGASVTATEKYVYVLRGDNLYQYSVDGLKLTAKAVLPRPEPQRPPQDGPGGPP